MAATKRIQIRLTEEVLVRLQVQAKRVGIAPATLASFIIGSTLARNEELLDRVVLGTIEALEKADREHDSMLGVNE